jgi:hypothetical protein
MIPQRSQRAAAHAAFTMIFFFAPLSGLAAGALGPAPKPAPTPAPTTAPTPGSTPTTAPAPANEAFGFDAPLLEVDRFSDRAATLLRRSARHDLPAPNAPIRLDAPPFLRDVVTADGRKAQCYVLDMRPNEPPRFYVFYDAIGNYILTQFPVVDVAPGDPGYSDVWDLWKVIVPDGFKPNNWVRDMETLRKLIRDSNSGYVAERTGALLNGPIVPEGSTAQRKAERRGGAAALRYVWYKGRRAPYLYFEEKLRLTENRTPTAKVKAPGGALPAEGALEVDSLAGDTGYSPLRVLVGADGVALPGPPLDCPVVGS